MKLTSCIAAAAWIAAASPHLNGAEKNELQVQVIDKETRQPLASRMHLKDSKGKPVKPPKVPYWKDHFVFDGVILLELAAGMYTFDLETGPEYRTPGPPAWSAGRPTPRPSR
jgi:hypothetical protein